MKVERAEFSKIDSGILAFTPKNSRSFVTSKLRKDETSEIWSGKQRLWVEILNKSCEFPIEIKKGCVLGFFVAEPEHLKFKPEPTQTKIEKKKNLLRNKKAGRRIPESL